MMLPLHPITEHDSAELWRACQSPTPFAQDRAYGDLFAYLFKIARYFVRDQPDADAMAQDCTQAAIEKVHRQITRCNEPRAFKAWARTILKHQCLDELRRRSRFVPLPSFDEHEPAADGDSREPVIGPLADATDIVTETDQRASVRDFRRLVRQAPISDRSKRVVQGRYLEDISDEVLAEIESGLSATVVRPNHVQTTRSKNFSKMVQWDPFKEWIAGRRAS